MEYKRYNDYIVARIDIGEEILTKIEEIAKKENIKLATINAIGAVDKAVIGIFIPEDKQYYSKEYKGDYEIVSLNGNITTKDNEVYIHTHIAIGDEKNQVFGGHLNEAYISVTGEVFINIIDGNVDRNLDESININLLKF